MEPATVVMARGPEYKNLEALKSAERRPGDGMEANLSSVGSNDPPTTESPSSSSRNVLKLTKKKLDSPERQQSWDSVKQQIKSLNLQLVKNKNETKKIEYLHSLPYSMDDLSVISSRNESSTMDYLDLSFVNEALKRKLALSESHNKQLVEEKMKLSHQIGIQTQVNNELKNLLVASIGDDLEQKYENMIHDKHLADLELKDLYSTLQEDREASEHAMIQADVWRSKFLASKVMSDELRHWKSVLYYKYRETHTALQTLLEEHSKIRALNQATTRNLINIVDLLESKDPSLDGVKGLTTVDVAYMINDLSESIYELLSHPKTKEVPCTIFVNDSPCYETSNKHLTFGESLAQEAILNTDVQVKKLSPMKLDYLSHNRISHFFSTNYEVTFNCCENCKGTLENI